MAFHNPWLRIGMEAWHLGYEASMVVGLRAMALAAGGPAAQIEARRMVAEKLDIGMELQMRLLTGALGSTPADIGRQALARLRREVRANHVRLSKPRDMRKTTPWRS